jgi:stage V sporulation protein SpoVS
VKHFHYQVKIAVAIKPAALHYQVKIAIAIKRAALSLSGKDCCCYQACSTFIIR